MTRSLILAGTCVLVALLALAWNRGWLREDTERTEWLGLQRVDEDFPAYRTIDFTWTLIRAGHTETGTHSLYLKIHNASDRLGLCGYMLMRNGGQSQNALRWLAEARLSVGPHRFRAAFINGATPGFSPADAQAGCVVTDIAWSAALATVPVSLAGPPLHEGK